MRTSSPPLSNALGLIFFFSSKWFPLFFFFVLSKLISSSFQALKTTTKDGNKEEFLPLLSCGERTPIFFSHTCGRIVPPYLNHPTWWDRVGVTKTPPFTFTLWRFDNDLSSLFMIAWSGGCQLFIRESLSLKMNGLWQLTLILAFFLTLPQFPDLPYPPVLP